jgi:hypothetical protein
MYRQFKLIGNFGSGWFLRRAGFDGLAVAPTALDWLAPTIATIASSNAAIRVDVLRFICFLSNCENGERTE